MTFKQKILGAFYPLLSWMQRGRAQRGVRSAEKWSNPNAFTSFYSLQATTIDGASFLFEPLKGKYVLLVNTASHCGYTRQLKALQQLQQHYASELVVLGFPSNDFGEQEPGSNADIEHFCKADYGVEFPLMQKNAVTGSNRQPVYAWLTQPDKNGWNKQAPEWNFCKYLVDTNGRLLHFFPAAIDPFDAAIINYLS